MKKVITLIFMVLISISYLNAKNYKDRFASVFVNHTLFINLRTIERKSDSLIIHFGNDNREWVISYEDFTTFRDSDKLLFFSLSQDEIDNILKKLEDNHDIVINFDTLTKTY